MTYVVEPLFAEWARFSDTRLSQTMLGHMGLNKASWGGLQQEQTSVSEEAEPSSAGVEAEEAAAAAAAARRDSNSAADAGGNGSKDIPQGSRESWLSPQPPDSGLRASPHTLGARWGHVIACNPLVSAPPDPNTLFIVLLLLPPILINHWFYLIYLIFNFLFFGIEQYIDTSFWLLLFFFLLFALFYLFVHCSFGSTDWTHHFLCWWNLWGKQYRNWRRYFFWYFEVPFKEKKKNLKNDLSRNKTTGVFRPSWDF